VSRRASESPAPSHSDSEQQEKSVASYQKTVIVGGGKGGVGKSFCAEAVIYCAQRAGLKPHLLAPDTSNPDVAKAHQTDGLPVNLLDLDIEDGWLELLNVRAEHSDRMLVVSTPSRSNLGIERFGSLLEEGLKELGAPLVTLWMIDGNRDCLEL
jgi:hypothetical protein